MVAAGGLSADGALGFGGLVTAGGLSAEDPLGFDERADADAGPSLEGEEVDVPIGRIATGVKDLGLRGGFDPGGGGGGGDERGFGGEEGGAGGPERARMKEARFAGGDDDRRSGVGRTDPGTRFSDEPDALAAGGSGSLRTGTGELTRWESSASSTSLGVAR